MEIACDNLKEIACDTHTNDLKEITCDTPYMQILGQDFLLSKYHEIPLKKKIYH